MIAVYFPPPIPGTASRMEVNVFEEELKEKNRRFI